ncbi:hypothetical protein EHS25_008765 [Saitozyma podzolica]|uniref:Uncharacterized protein n=1 Tax=Saitozyma podzolica TaxID=1890683 RepID=A0A427YMS0_9TREE|nr:hypothetical protein EHS25_008765 [Saitozyma podzolica]
MSANPPILSIPAQSPDPISHINTFLASLAPHVSEHAAIGTREFGDQRPESRPEDGWRGRVGSLDVDPGQRGWSEGMPREDFRFAAGAGEGSAGLAFQRPHGYLASRRRPPTDSLPRIDTTPQAVRVASLSDPDRLPLERDMGSVSPTESARRRHARKIRRREKAAILNARPPPSPTHSAHARPAPKRRSPESDSEAGRALSEILSGERRTIGGRGKRRRTQSGMDLIRRWKPENVVSSRLTSIVDPAVRRSHEFIAVDGVAHREAVPPRMEWEGSYMRWEEYRDDGRHTGVDAGQAVQTEESEGKGWRKDGMESGSFLGANERGPWNVPGEELQWKGIGDGAYGVQAGAARGDNDVHMKMDTDMGMGTGTGMGSGMDRGMGIDIGPNGMHRDPPLQWQQFDWSAQVGRRSTLRTENDEWKRFWQRKNNG